jgi:hypothetical protein
MATINSRKFNNATNAPQDVQEIIRVITEVADSCMGLSTSLYTVDGALCALVAMGQVDADFSCLMAATGDIEIAFMMVNDPTVEYTLMLVCTAVP